MTALFLESLNNHQEIIDVLLKHKMMDGYCRILKKDIIPLLSNKRSYPWLKQAMNRINSEGMIIREVEIGVFEVLHEHLLDFGVFKITLEVMADIVKNPEKIVLGDFELMEMYGISRQIIYKVRAYLTSGWKEKLYELYRKR